jgi:glycosyltransferase involved in cell wall biosynthesis
MTSTPRYELSAIIASHNRRELLRRCLDSLAGQTQDPDTFEVIVVDDGSSDGTAEMLRKIEPPFNLRVKSSENRGQSEAQREALSAARGTVCLLLDDDVVASPRLVAEHIAGHRENPDCLGIGSLTQKPPDARDWYAHTFARVWNAHYAELAGRDAQWIDCWGGNLSFPRRSVIEIGGIPTCLPAAFDFELALRLCRAGCVPHYLPHAHGVHDDQKRWSRMISDARRQGAAYIELIRRLPESEADLRRWSVLRWSVAIGPRELLLRRLMIALRLPPAPLVWLGGLLRDEFRQEIWLGIVRRLALWQGARKSLTRAEWALLTSDKSLSVPHE